MAQQILSTICNGNQLEAYGHGRGTRYHIHGVNVALTKTHEAINVSKIGIRPTVSDLFLTFLGFIIFRSFFP